MNTELLDIYTDYLISQSQYATATGLAAMLNGEVSHDQISRLLRADDYGSKDLWAYVKPHVRQHEQKTGGVLLLDDTISEKTYTDENAVNYWHFSHAKHRHVKGINLLSCLVRYARYCITNRVRSSKKRYSLFGYKNTQTKTKSAYRQK